MTTKFPTGDEVILSSHRLRFLFSLSNARHSPTRASSKPARPARLLRTGLDGAPSHLTTASRFRSRRTSFSCAHFHLQDSSVTASLKKLPRLAEPPQPCQHPTRCAPAPASPCCCLQLKAPFRLTKSHFDELLDNRNVLLSLCWSRCALEDRPRIGFHERELALRKAPYTLV